MPIFSYGGDSLFHVFVVKNIIDMGWFSSNDLVGLPHISGKFFLHDFPIHASLFSLFVIKVIANFSSNAFFVTNIFIIFTFCLVATTSFIALRSFKIGLLSAMLVSVLYAFMPYHLFKNVSHLFLSNYSVIPFVVMVAIWIMNDVIQFVSTNAKGAFCLRPNKHFYAALAVAVFVSMNGIYYAFYSCIIFIFAWFLSSLRTNQFFDKNCFLVVILCLAILSSLCFIFLEPLFYWMQNGVNSMVGARSPQDSETYALKFYKLFLPVTNHYVEYLRNMRAAFDQFSTEYESRSAALGLLSSIGLVFLLIWILAKNQTNQESSIFNKMITWLSLHKKDQNMITNLANLSLLSILFSMVGGLVMFVAVLFPLLRSHARFSVFIGFFVMVFIAMIFDKIVQKKIFNRQFIAPALVILITVMSLFDQIGKISAQTIQSDMLKSQFQIDQAFIQEVEEKNPNADIFILPVFGFPEAAGDSYQSLLGYLHSKDLRWSYPVAMGRESHLWQEKVVQLDFANFIKELKRNGFSAIMIDRQQYILGKGVDLNKMEFNLQNITKNPAIISQDKKFVLYRI